MRPICRTFVLAIAVVGTLVGSARGVQLNLGDLIVTDRATNAVYRLDPGTGLVDLISQSPTDGALIDFPAGVVATGPGFSPIFVTDAATDSLVEIDPSIASGSGGNQSAVPIDPGINNPWGAHLLSANTLLVTNVGSTSLSTVEDALWSVPTAGGGTSITDNNLLLNPTGAVRAPDGFYYVVNPGLTDEAVNEPGRIVQVNPGTGNQVQLGGTFGVDPTAITYHTGLGTLFVADQSGGTGNRGKVFEISLAGAVLNMWEDAAYLDPLGITVGLDGLIYTTDEDSGKVFSLDPTSGVFTPISMAFTNPVAITTVVPEPGSGVLIGCALLGVVMFSRRRLLQKT
jgi:hypothetical protein